MFKIKTYRDREPYLTLGKVWGIFLDVNKKHDFKKIAEEEGVLESTRCMIMFATRIYEITDSILSLSGSYSAIILYRSLIEHIFKCLYICLCSKENDNAGQTYFSTPYIAHEQFLKLKKAFFPERVENKIKFKDFLNEIGHEGEFITDKEFQLTKIVKNLFEMLSAEGDLEKGLKRALIEYSISSSYVHGGPTAVMNPKTEDKAGIDKMAVGISIASFSTLINRFSAFHVSDQDGLKSTAQEITRICKDYLRNQWPEYYDEKNKDSESSSARE